MERDSKEEIMFGNHEMAFLGTFFSIGLGFCRRRMMRFQHTSSSGWQEEVCF